MSFPLERTLRIKPVPAGNTSEHSSQNKSSSGSIGVGFNIGGPSTGLSVNANASRAKGQADGESQSSTNTRLQAGGTLTFNSGGDTTLQGATASAKQVTGTVGGNLNLSSLQDTSQYKENSQSSGFSVSVPITGGAASASVSHSQTSIDSHYQSVGEQTAIRAGDGGFDIDVKGKTTLTGAQITSTDKAVQGGKNSFKSAGGIDMQDLQNSAQYDASSYAVTLAKGSEPNKAPVLSGAGIGADSGQASSTSTSGISGIAGDTSARTGDEETGLKPLFDAAKVKQEVQAQVAITSEFGKQAGKAIKDYSEEQRKSLREQAKNASTPEEKAQTEQALKDVNMQERALNILVGALTGFGGTMLSKEAFSMAGEKMRDLMIEDSQKFAGVVDSTGKPLFSNISGDSSGVNDDGHKIGGTRADLDLLCGAGGARCDISKNPDGSIDSSKPVKFLGDEVLNPDGTTSRKSYEDFLKTADGQKMLSAPFGGLQGGDRTLFGQPYEKGSWQDKLIEAFAGPHDLIGGKLSGLYDAQGNATQERTPATIKTQNLWSAAALLPAAPFAASQLLSPEIWKAIAILLKAGQ
ncbi:hemagglutinin repeat-containing protein [Limnohabitans sp.]|uniref:hemagglutinin repeat-containing protein n=1 Tax=Limnohabitans sp. TaxID=1907725 RepID=UPI0031FE2D7C